MVKQCSVGVGEGGGSTGETLAGELTAQVTWLGLRVGGRLALFYIHQMNRVNSRNDLWSWWQHYKYRPWIIIIIIIIMYWFWYNTGVRRTDGRTDGEICRNNIALCVDRHMMTRDKNQSAFWQSQVKSPVRLSGIREVYIINTHTLDG